MQKKRRTVPLRSRRVIVKTPPPPLPGLADPVRSPLVQGMTLTRRIELPDTGDLALNMMLQAEHAFRALQPADRKPALDWLSHRYTEPARRRAR